MPPGPTPKPGSARARTNKHSTNAVLRSPEEGEIEVPPLPEIAGEDGIMRWHVMTVWWWKDIWASPMAPEFTDADIHGLYGLALIVNDFWNARTAKERQACAAEMRLQSVRFGLSPIDRRRLQWEIEKSDEAQAKGRKRRRDETPADPSPAPTGDAAVPRALVRGV